MARSCLSNAMMSAMLLLLPLLLQCPSAAASDASMTFLNSSDNIRPGTAIIAVLAIFIGAAMGVAGYKFFRYSVFICGFIVGGTCFASLVEIIFANQSFMNTLSWIAFFLGGILVGMAATQFYNVAIFVIGAAAGLLLACVVHTTLTYLIYQTHPNIVLLILAIVLGIVGGMAALRLEKPVLIAATSFVGAVCLVWGIGYFAGSFPNAADLKHFSAQNNDGDTHIWIPSVWWAYLTCIIILTALGAWIQWKKTSHGHDHRSHRYQKSRLTLNAIPASYSDVQTPTTQANVTTASSNSHSDSLV